jgi:hypothetical protein
MVDPIDSPVAPSGVLTLASAELAAADPIAQAAIAHPNERMRPAAWSYLLALTSKYEGAVLHMYNNAQTRTAMTDVTCGVGFRIDPRAGATEASLKGMFFDPATNLPATDQQMLDDWDAAAALLRTGSNLRQYGRVCRLRMSPDKVYARMAQVLNEKTDVLLSTFPSDFSGFVHFPAAAQVFCVSFAYTYLKLSQFPKLRASIRAHKWTDAAAECQLQGLSSDKNDAHRQLLLFAQTVVNRKFDPDTLPNLNDLA